MRALILLVLIAIVQKSSCDSRDIDKIMKELFPPPPDGGSTNGDNGSSNSSNNESDEELEMPCGTTKPSNGPEFKSAIPGAVSKYLEFPWMVALYLPTVKSQRCELADHKCWRFGHGGSLISSKVVLTAAHCVDEYMYGKIKVRAGDWNLDTLEDPLPYQERSVSKFIVHPQYHRGSRARYLKYDAALLIVESPYTLSDNIGFICLPSPDLNMASTSCKLTGWGVQTFGASGYQALLKVVDLNYMNHDLCQATLRRKWLSRFNLHESHTCASGVPGEGACHGDGGGPLMCIENDHYYARGILSWIVGCGQDNNPNMFTDIIKMRNWIDQEMTANGFSTDTYTHVTKSQDVYVHK